MRNVLHFRYGFLCVRCCAVCTYDDWKWSANKTWQKIVLHLPFCIWKVQNKTGNHFILWVAAAQLESIILWPTWLLSFRDRLIGRCTLTVCAAQPNQNKLMKCKSEVEKVGKWRWRRRNDYRPPFLIVHRLHWIRFAIIRRRKERLLFLLQNFFLFYFTIVFQSIFNCCLSSFGFDVEIDWDSCYTISSDLATAINEND